MSPKLYDALKFIAQVLLPALGTLYVALAALWGLPNPEAVSGTVLALDTALGTLLHLSSSAYNNSDAKYDGAVNVIPTPNGGKTFELELHKGADDLERLDERKELLFKVKKAGKVAVGEREWNARH